jgi:hypothetical protein
VCQTDALDESLVIGTGLHHSGAGQFIQANVFRCPPTGYDERIIVFGFDLCEGSIQGKIVPGLFAVSLISLEIV